MTATKATNLDERLLPAVNAALRFAVSSDLSDFYKKKYAGAFSGPLASPGDLRRLPFLTRAEISAIPWKSRLFVPENELGSFTISSGTTGDPLILPGLPPGEHSVNDGQLEPLGVRGVMLLMPPFSGMALSICANLPKRVRVISGDVRDMRLSARIAAELEVNGFATTYTGLERLLEAMDELKLDPAAIKWVSVGAEPVSGALNRYLRARLPNAFFHVRYNAAEFGMIRYCRCPALDGNPAAFHPRPASHIFEVVRRDGSAAEQGEPGELVHTDIVTPKAFPFMRYRTGDGASAVFKPCACGNPWTLTLTGKSGRDALKYGGISLREDRMLAALRKVSDFVKEDFRLHLREETRPSGRPVPSVELVLVPLGRRPLGPAAEELEARLAGIISENFQVSGGQVFADISRKGYFLPLKVTLLDAFPAGTEGEARLTSHIS